ncbi:MAG: S1C family serine protease [Actinomycetota bacterium]|nr:S1C family serine protease [Actinomycetota bacterium]
MESQQEHPQELEAPPRRRAQRLAAGLVLVTMIGGAVGGYAIARAQQSSPTSVSSTSAVSATPSTNAARGVVELTLAEIQAAVDPALVDVTASLGGSGTAKGTGMVISSTGEILANNHVVSGATSITVQIAGTGPTYRATLVGYGVSDDVAVLQIPNVSGLTTIKTASASTVSANDTVVAIGNALGQDGTPVAAEGVVTAVDQTITASDETGPSQETLNGLIEISAAVQPGDSGGATVNTYGQVIGMTTAAASGGFRPMSTASIAPTTTTAYAIPIDAALSIARQIESGIASETVHIGEHGLFGVQVAGGYSSSSNGGAQVVGVQSGSAAAAAGIVAGDAIVSIDGHTIGSVSDLNDAMASTHSGDKITVGWQDGAGQSHDATVTLTTGAA